MSELPDSLAPDSEPAAHAARPEPIVLLDDVHVTLPGPNGPVNVLRGVSLGVAPRETLSLVGPSGSGKTTTLMVAAGLERATSGTVRVAGHDLTALGEDELARFRRARVGVVFQAFHLVPTMTALENVALPLEFAGRSDAFARARKALADVGLAGRADHYPAQLSGGEQQRVAIARACAPDPALLLADEPTGNLDSDTGARVMDLLFAMRERTGATLVLITHDAGLAARCARTVRMENGRIFAAAEAPGAAAGEAAEEERGTTRDAEEATKTQEAAKTLDATRRERTEQ